MSSIDGFLGYVTGRLRAQPRGKRYTDSSIRHVTMWSYCVVNCTNSSENGWCMFKIPRGRHPFGFCVICWGISNPKLPKVAPYNVYAMVQYSSQLRQVCTIFSVLKDLYMSLWTTCGTVRWFCSESCLRQKSGGAAFRRMCLCLQPVSVATVSVSLPYFSPVSVLSPAVTETLTKHQIKQSFWL